MGGGGNFLGDVAKVVTNPVGYAVKQATGNSTLATLANPIGAIANRLIDGPKKIQAGGDLRDTRYSGQDTDEQGRPILREFDSQLGPNGLLKSQYMTQNTLDRRGLEAMRGEALRDPGTMSRWGQMALSQAQDQNAAGVAGQTAQARNQLAMQGGLRSGARERLAMQGMQNQLRGNQQALGNVQMQDEQNRQKWLGMLPGQETAAAQFDTTIQDRNIGRSMDELRQGRDFDKYRYGQAMTAWGADKSSEAMKRAAEDAKSTSGLFGSGGFLGLGL